MSPAARKTQGRVAGLTLRVRWQFGLVEGIALFFSVPRCLAHVCSCMRPAHIKRSKADALVRSQSCEHSSVRDELLRCTNIRRLFYRAGIAVLTLRQLQRTLTAYGGGEEPEATGSEIDSSFFFVFRVNKYEPETEGSGGGDGGILSRTATAATHKQCVNPYTTDDSPTPMHLHARTATRTSSVTPESTLTRHRFSRSCRSASRRAHPSSAARIRALAKGSRGRSPPARVAPFAISEKVGIATTAGGGGR